MGQRQSAARVHETVSQAVRRPQTVTTLGSGLNRYYAGDYLCFDIEGESLNLRTSRPWQVAWAIASLQDGIKSMSVVHPYWADLRVSRDAAIKTRFNPVEYAKVATPAEEALAQFNAALYNPIYKVVAQNILGYDLYVHANWCRACKQKPDWETAPIQDTHLFRIIDTHAILKARVKSWKPDLSSPEAFLCWQYRSIDFIERGLRTNLEHVGKEMKIDHDYSTTHGAVSDTELLWKIFKRAVYEVEF